MRLNLIRLFIFLACALVESGAYGTSLRVSAGFGFGSSSTSDEISDSEGPLTQMYTIEYPIHSRLIVGAEHLRSFNLSPMSTAISFTGIFGRYYLNAFPAPYASANDLKANELIIRDVSYFVGGGIGLAQSNLFPDENGKSSNAAGVYLSPQGGFELALSRKIGVRGELAYAMTVLGSGSISSVSLIGAIYYVF